jgi:hypothetical protein
MRVLQRPRKFARSKLLYSARIPMLGALLNCGESSSLYNIGLRSGSTGKPPAMRTGPASRSGLVGAQATYERRKCAGLQPEDLSSESDSEPRMSEDFAKSFNPCGPHTTGRNQRSYCMASSFETSASMSGMGTGFAWILNVCPS